VRERIVEDRGVLEQASLLQCTVKHGVRENGRVLGAHGEYHGPIRGARGRCRCGTCRGHRGWADSDGQSCFEHSDAEMQLGILVHDLCDDGPSVGRKQGIAYTAHLLVALDDCSEAALQALALLLENDHFEFFLEAAQMGGETVAHA
jgi:hypothetical protein